MRHGPLDHNPCALNAHVMAVHETEGVHGIPKKNLEVVRGILQQDRHVTCVGCTGLTMGCRGRIQMGWRDDSQYVDSGCRLNPQP